MTKRIPSFILFIFLFCTFNSFAATKTASVTGAWSNTATWGGEAAPVTGGSDVIIISTGISVTMNADYTTTGTLTLNGTGTIQMAGYALAGGSLAASGSAVINNASTAKTLTVGSDNSSTTYTGTFTNNVKLVKTGSGTMTLSTGTSSFLYIDVQAGTVTVSSGSYTLTSNIGNGQAVQAAGTSAVFNVSGGTVNCGSNSLVYGFSTVYGFGTGNGSGTISGGTVSGVDLILGWNATGTLTISGGTNTFTTSVKHNDAGDGTLTLSGGTLTTPLVRNSSDASGTDYLTVNINSGGAITATTFDHYSTHASGTHTTTVNLAGGTITSKATGTLFDVVSGGGGGQNFYIYDNSGGPTTINTNGFTSTVSQPILVGTGGGITKSGTGTLVFSAINTYTSATLVSAGTLKLGAAGVISNSSALTVSSGATFDLNSYSETVGSIAGAGTINNVSGAGTPTLTCGGDNTSTTFSGTIANTTGTLSLTKTGSGTLTCSGGNNITLDGTVTTSAGTLKLVDCDALAKGSSTTTFSIAASATLELNANSQDIYLGSTCTGGTIFSGTGTLQKTGAYNLFFGGQGASTYLLYMNMTGGTIDVQAGYIINGGWQGTYWTNNKASLNIASGATFDIWNGNTVYVDALTGAGNVGIGFNGGTISLQVGVNNGSGTFTGVILAGSSPIALTKLGTGTQTLSGVNTYTGSTTVSAGTLKLGAAGVIPDASAVTVASGATLDMNSKNETIGSLAGAGIVDNAAGGSSVTLTCGGDNTSTTFSGVIKNTSGTLAICKSGAGVYQQTGTNTYSGGTTIAGSCIRANNASSFGTSTVTISANAFALLWAPSALTITNNFVLNGSSGNSSYPAISHDGGAGLVTLSGTITLNANSEVGLGGTSSNNMVLSGVISGGFTLTIDELNVIGNPYTTTLSGTNTYTGSTVVSAGTLKLGAAGVISNSSALTVSSGATFDLNSYSETVGSIAGAGTINNVSAAGTPTLTCGGDGTSTTFSGVISNTTGTVALTKEGAGSLVLSGANTYTGTTTISAGTLQLGAAARISNSSHVVMNGGYLSTGSGAGYNETVNTLRLSANSRIVLGTGSHALNFAASNGTTWTAGTLLRIDGWQGGFNSTTGTSGQIFTGSSAELSAGKLAQIFFTKPISGNHYTASQLASGEIVPTSTLPVKLVSFTGEKGKNFNELYWITASEINSEYFEVQRSSDGVNFESIGKVHAAGNSNDILQYTFVDYEQPSGTSYYRLKQYDYDGQNETFNIVAIDNDSSNEFEMNALFPNPTSAAMTVNFHSSESGSHFIFINDAQGKEVFAAMIASLQGQNKFSLPTQNYASGTYFVRIVSPKKETISSQIVLQH